MQVKIVVKFLFVLSLKFPNQGASLSISMTLASVKVIRLCFSIHELIEFDTMEAFVFIEISHYL